MKCWQNAIHSQACKTDNLGPFLCGVRNILSSCDFSLIWVETVYSSHFIILVFQPPPLRWWQVHNNFAPAEQLSWQQFKKLGQDKRTNSFPNETPSQHYCRLFIRKCKALVFIILWSIGVMAPKRSLSGPSLLINVLCKCSFFLPKSASKRFKLKLKHFSTIISSWRWIAYTCTHTHTPPYRRWPGSTVRVIYLHSGTSARSFALFFCLEFCYDFRPSEAYLLVSL